jgi:hypothetical protein
MLFNKGNRERFFRVPISYRNTCGSLGETRNWVETLALRARVPKKFLIFPKFHLCLYLTISRRRRGDYQLIFTEPRIVLV